MERITSRLFEKDYMLNLAIYNVNREIVSLGEMQRNTLSYGHECIFDRKKLRQLCSILGLLEDEREILALGGECLPLEKLESLLGKFVVLSEEGARADLEIDRSGLDLWIALNPDSVPQQKWEEAACNVACDYELVLTADPKLCQYELTSKGDVLDCDLIAEFAAIHKACALEIESLSFREQCALEFDILSTDKACRIGFETYKKVQGCELDLDGYVCLRECNLDQKIIRTVLAAGCTINVGDLS